MAITLAQAVFRFRTDALAADQTTAGACTWGAAQNVNYNPPVNTPFRIRFIVQNTGSTTSGSVTWNLRYQKNGTGGYVQVPNTSSGNSVYSVDATAGASSDNSALTHSLLTGGSGTFLTTGQYDDTGSTGSFAITATHYAEFEFGLEFNGTNCAVGDYFDFRIYDGTTALTAVGSGGAYTVTPRAFPVRDNGSLTITLADVVLSATAYTQGPGESAPGSPVQNYVFRVPSRRAWRKRKVGKLAAIIVQAIPGAGSMYAAGALTAGIGPQVAGAGSLYAAQALSVSTSESVAITGAGSLAAATGPTPVVAQPVTGAGITFGAGSLGPQTTGPLPSAGTPYSATVPTIAVAVSASAGSSFTAGTLTPAATLSVSGTGSSASAGSITPQVTPSLDGGLGTLYAEGTFAASIAPGITGAGSLNSTSSFGVAVTAPSAGSLTAAGSLAFTGSGAITLTGTGSQESATSFTPGLVAQLTGSGSLYSASSVVAGIAPTLTGAGSLYNTGLPIEVYGRALAGAGSTFALQSPLPGIAPLLLGAGSKYAVSVFSLSETSPSARSLYASGSLLVETSGTQTVALNSFGSKYSLFSPTLSVSVPVPSAGSLYAATSPAVVLVVNVAGAGQQYAATSLSIGGTQAVLLVGSGTQYGIFGATQLTIFIPSLEMTILPSAGSLGIGLGGIGAGTLFAARTLTTVITLPSLPAAASLYSAGNLAAPAAIIALAGAGSVYTGGLFSTGGSQTIPLPALGSGSQYAAFGATQLTIFIPSLEMTILPSAATFVLGGGIISFPGARSSVSSTSFGEQISTLGAGSLYAAMQLGMSTIETAGIVGSGITYFTGLLLSSAISLAPNAGSRYATGSLGAVAVALLTGAGSPASITLSAFAFAVPIISVGSLFAASTYGVTIQYPVVVGMTGAGSMYYSGNITYQTAEVLSLLGAGILNSAGSLYLAPALVGTGTLYTAADMSHELLVAILTPGTNTAAASFGVSVGTSVALLLTNVGLPYTAGILGYSTAEIIAVAGAGVPVNIGSLYAAPSLPSIQSLYAAGDLSTGGLIEIFPLGIGSAYAATIFDVTTDVSQTAQLFGARLPFASGELAVEIDESLLFTGARILASNGVLAVAMALAGAGSSYSASTLLAGITVSALGLGSAFSSTTFSTSISTSQVVQLSSVGSLYFARTLGYATSEPALIPGIGVPAGIRPLYVAGTLIGSGSLYAADVLVVGGLLGIPGLSSLFAAGLYYPSVSEGISQTIPQIGLGSPFATSTFSYVTNETIPVSGLGSKINSGSLIFTSGNVYPLTGSGSAASANDLGATIVQLYLSGLGSLFASTSLFAPAQTVQVNLTGLGSPAAARTVFEALGIGLLGSGLATAAVAPIIRIAALAAGIGSHANLNSLLVATGITPLIPGIGVASSSGLLSELLAPLMQGTGSQYEANGFGAAQITTMSGAGIVSSVEALGPVGIAISAGIGVEFTAGSCGVVTQSGVAALVGVVSNDNIENLGALGQGLFGAGSPTNAEDMSNVYPFIPRASVTRIARRTKQRIRVARIVA